MAASSGNLESSGEFSRISRRVSLRRNPGEWSLMSTTSTSTWIRWNLSLENATMSKETRHRGAPGQSCSRSMVSSPTLRSPSLSLISMAESCVSCMNRKDVWGSSAGSMFRSRERFPITVPGASSSWVEYLAVVQFTALQIRKGNSTLNAAPPKLQSPIVASVLKLHQRREQSYRW